MTVRRVTWGCTVLALAVSSCSWGDPETSTTSTVPTTVVADTTTTVPERPTSTTTTAFDPASVEGEVEAAYLRSWDVYADAVYDLELDEAALAEVYAEDGLDAVRQEIQRRIDDNSPSLVLVDHDYEIALAGPTSANVIDRLVNHQVLIDPDSKAPIEDDPNEEQLLNFKLDLVNEGWRVTLIQRVTE